MDRACFGLLVTTRGFFNPAIAKIGRKRLISKLQEKGHRLVSLSEEEGKFGCVESYDDALICANKFKKYRDEIDGILISAPNFGDEVSTVNAIRLSELDVPIMVHAFDDELNHLDLANRRDSFCGKLSICSNLNQFGIKFTNTHLHTCDPDSDEFMKDLDYFDSVCKVRRGLRGARIAQFGTRPAAFQTVRFSERLLERSGITVIPVDLAEVIEQSKTMKDHDQIEKVVNEIKDYGNVPACISEDNVQKSAKLFLTIRNFMELNRCDAGAFQCWDSIQKYYGCASCLPMSMLSQIGKSMSCETDVMGAISMLALQYASGSASAYLDWNNNYANDRNKCIMIHCGNYPKDFFAREIEISNLDILGASLGEEKCFGACKAVVAPGPISYAKVTTDDMAGEIKAYVGEGNVTDDPVDTKGAPAVVHIPNLQQLMNYICMNSFEHHVAMNRSNVADALEEAMQNYMGWRVYRHH